MKLSQLFIYSVFSLFLVSSFVACTDSSSDKQGVTLKGGESSGGGGDTIRSEAEEIQKYIELLNETMGNSSTKVSQILFRPIKAIVNDSIRTLKPGECEDASCLLMNKITQERDKKYVASVELILGEKLTFVNKGPSSLSYVEETKALKDLSERISKELNLSKFSYESCLSEEFLKQDKKASYQLIDGEHRFCMDKLRLTHIDSSSMKEQVLALLAHEIVHMLGVSDEDSANAFQNRIAKEFERAKASQMSWYLLDSLERELYKFLPSNFNSCPLVQDYRSTADVISSILKQIENPLRTIDNYLEVEEVSEKDSLSIDLIVKTKLFLGHVKGVESDFLISVPELSESCYSLADRGVEAHEDALKAVQVLKARH